MRLACKQPWRTMLMVPAVVVVIVVVIVNINVNMTDWLVVVAITRSVCVQQRRFGIKIHLQINKQATLAAVVAVAAMRVAVIVTLRGAAVAVVIVAVAAFV